MPNPLAWVQTRVNPMAWWRAARQRLATPGAMATFVFAVSLAVFAALTPRFMRIMYYPTGDEPYYLLATHSLIHDRDFNLENNFENKDYWHYYPGELYPRHESKTKIAGLYSKHSLGVSLLILPAYALGEWRHTYAIEFFPKIPGLKIPFVIRQTDEISDWRYSVYMYNILAALLAANTYLLAYEVSRRRWIALLIWLSFTFTNPLMSYAFLIFPALVSALLTVYGYRRIRLDGVTSPLVGNGPVRFFVVDLCLGFLPWLHPRFLPVSFSLLAYMVWREITSRRRRSSPERDVEEANVDHAQGRAALPSRRGTLTRLVAFALPAAVCAVLFLAYYWTLYGTFMPNYMDHAGMGKPGEWVVAVFGSFLDQQWGFFIHAPVYILALVGLLLMWRQARGELFWLAAICLPYAAVILTYSQWWGEWCPAARYWVSLVPLLAVPMGMVLAVPLKRVFLALYLSLAAISWAIMAIFMYEPHLMYNHPTGKSRLLEWIAASVHVPTLQPLVPTYFIVDWSNVWLTILYTELVAVIVWLGWKQVRG